jgi:predicted TIM-barrel fold metal-dependent hydrolase
MPPLGRSPDHVPATGSILTGVPIPSEPKIDCHLHLLDPRRFPYHPQAWYHPVDSEQGSAEQLIDLFDAFGVEHAVVVGPNSGYDTDNRCLLDLLDRGRGRFKGVAVVDNEISRDELVTLKDRGVVGTTMQAALLGVEHFAGTGPLLRTLRELGMVADVQVQGDQLVDLAPLLDESGVDVLIDHCGRPDPAKGLNQPGFAALLRAADSGRYRVKLSGLVKCSGQRYPWPDSWPYVQALLDAFGPQRCLWGSDWPFLRAPERIDYATVLALTERLLPDPAVREQILWNTPARLFGFAT